MRIDTLDIYELRLLGCIRHCNDDLAVPYAVSPSSPLLPTLTARGYVIAEMEERTVSALPFYALATITEAGRTALLEHEQDPA